MSSLIFGAVVGHSRHFSEHKTKAALLDRAARVLNLISVITHDNILGHVRTLYKTLALSSIIDR